MRKKNIYFFSTVFLILFCLTAFSTTRDVEKPKIFISADIEGIAHVVKSAFGPGDYGYERARILMTEEVNAAIAGCLEGGAGEILVADSHGNCMNIIPEKLHEAAELVRSFPRPLDMMDGIDETYDGVIFIGYHAKAGTPQANIAHTMFGSLTDLSLNGLSVSEALFNAAVAGEYGVPVIMVSGDQHVVREAKKSFGSVETVVTKESRGYVSARSPHPKKVRMKLKERCKLAVQKINIFEPFRIQPPIKMEITFKNTHSAEALCYFPWFKRVEGNTVAVEVKNMKEAAGVIVGLGAVSSGGE